MTTILSIRDLIVDFKTRAGNARILNEISLELNSGEILGIVGEPGCGKSMTALSVMGLVPSPSGQIISGSILLEGEDLVRASTARMRQIRGGIISMIFQEQVHSLNPMYRVGDQIAESVLLHEAVTKTDAWERALEMLTKVGMREPEIWARAYPHELSRGLRLRVEIAMALSCRPRILILDEPTAALDVTVQAQIFDLLKDLQRETGTAIILITDDMGAIFELADRVAVMCAGNIIETGTTEDILSDPQHPYTRGLIACIPHLEADLSEKRLYLSELKEGVLTPEELGQGCAFAPRCPYNTLVCEEIRPPIKSINGAHSVACHNIKYVVAV